MLGYVYVLRCKDNSYYVGSTRDIEKRVLAHKNGLVKYTKSRLPLKLIFVKKFEDYPVARSFENRVKS